MKFLLSLIFALGIQAQSLHNISVTWTDPNNPSGTEYNVYRATGACSATLTFAKLNTTPVPSLNFVDGTVVPFVTYCYYVTATNGTVESSPSVQAGATALPFSPASLTLKAN